MSCTITNIPNDGQDVSISLPGGATDIVVDELNLAQACGVKWFVNYKNTTIPVFRSLEVMAVRKDSADASDSIDSKIGDNIKIDLKVEVNGTDFQLILTNNEAYTVDVGIKRITF